MQLIKSNTLQYINRVKLTRIAGKYWVLIHRKAQWCGRVGGADGYKDSPLEGDRFFMCRKCAFL